MSPWLGDIPTWITTVAILIAGAQFIAERKRRRREEDGESKAQASCLSAWAVSDTSESGRAYGVVVSNRSRSTFHDLRLQAVLHGETDLEPVVMTVVPPGEYFIELAGTKAHRSWEFSLSIDEYNAPLRPYTRTDRYGVTSLEFTDNHEERWTADAHMVLQRVS